MARLDWEKAKSRDLLKRRAAPKKKPEKRKSPASKKRSTKAQRRHIASLARECGVKPGPSRSLDAASFEINRLKALLAEIRRRS